MTRPMSQRQAISIRQWLRSRYVAAAFSQGGTLITTYALIQSIYPLIVFILVALDKVHRFQMPQNLRNDGWSGNRGATVTVSLEVDVERSAASGLMIPSGYPMLTFPGPHDNPSTVGDGKPSPLRAA